MKTRQTEQVLLTSQTLKYPIKHLQQAKQILLNQVP